jgi:hypothetical protein
VDRWDDDSWYFILTLMQVGQDYLMKQIQIEEVDDKKSANLVFLGRYTNRLLCFLSANCDTTNEMFTSMMSLLYTGLCQATAKFYLESENLTFVAKMINDELTRLKSSSYHDNKLCHSLLDMMMQVFQFISTDESLTSEVKMLMFGNDSMGKLIESVSHLLYRILQYDEQYVFIISAPRMKVCSLLCFIFSINSSFNVFFKEVNIIKEQLRISAIRNMCLLKKYQK